jgi:hypothetical protein
MMQAKVVGIRVEQALIEGLDFNIPAQPVLNFFSG